MIAEVTFCAECERRKIGLTDRQIEMLEKLAQGATTPDLAEDMFLGLSTVKREVMLIHEKMGTKTRAHAVAEAIRLGFI